ncbi:MAG: ComEC/Rec2 family competence protein, partial [Mariprofundaceae bacterium]|nr:ComEC/Rec2 family competence protein [Mariprofundaceae bacterium]
MAVGAMAMLLFVLHFRSLPSGNKLKSQSFVFSAALLAGLVWAWGSLLLDARQMLADEAWQQGRVAISATIGDVQPHSAYRRFTLKDVVREDTNGEDGVHLRGRVWVYAHRSWKSSGEKHASHASLLAGDRVRLVASLHSPRNQRNPGGFDFVSFCFDRHIAMLGSVHGQIYQIKAGASALELARQRIRRALHGIEPAQAGVLRAMLLGERYRIPESVYDIFSATGAAHLLAISGLHIGMVAAIGFALCWFVLTRREVWIINLPVRGLALLAGLLCAIAYATLAGWPLPTQRAAMMLAAAAMAWCLRAYAAPLNFLLAALMLILLLNASALGSLSLWLSFAATAGILLWVSEPVDEKRSLLARWVIGILMITLVASMVTLPLIAHYFGRLPTYSLPANMLITPLYTLFVLPLSLLAGLLAAGGMDWAAHGLFLLAAAGVDAGNTLLTVMTRWPAGRLWLPEVPLWLSGLYLAGMGVAARLLYRRLHLRAGSIAIFTLLLYCALAVQERSSDGMQLVLWDVGQGAAASLHLPGEWVMVADAPGRPGSRFNGGTVLADGLRGMGLTHVDVLLISHAQSDHIGGALSLLRRLNSIGELWLADVPQMRNS